MDPVVKTPWRGLCFCLVMVFFLLLPLGLGLSGHWSQRDAFDAMPDINKDAFFTYISQQIYDETAPIDLLIIGDSYVWTGLNARILQEELSKKLGRKITVVSVAHPFPGSDLDYIILKAMLSKRSVGYIVMDMQREHYKADHMHVNTYHLFNPIGNGEFFENIPLNRQAALYGAAVLGSARHLLSLLRPEVRNPAKFESENGSAVMPLGLDQQPGSFQATEVKPKVFPAEEMIYNPKKEGVFKFAGTPLGPYSRHFLELISGLSERHGTRIIVAHIPRLLFSASRETDDGKDNAFIIERERWQEVFRVPVDIVGIPGAKLFHGIDTPTLKQLYYSDHLNANGTQFFTRSITPAFTAILKRPGQPKPRVEP